MDEPHIRAVSAEVFKHAVSPCRTFAHSVQRYEYHHKPWMYETLGADAKFYEQ